MSAVPFADVMSPSQEENQTQVDTVAKKKTSKLDVKIQSLLELICDLKAMEECVLEMKFDTRKAPLGESDSYYSIVEEFVHRQVYFLGIFAFNRKGEAERGRVTCCPTWESNWGLLQ